MKNVSRNDRRKQGGKVPVGGTGTPRSRRELDKHGEQ